MSRRLAKETYQDSMKDYFGKWRLWLSLHSEENHAHRAQQAQQAEKTASTHAHPSTEHARHEEMHLEVTHRELFFDLIFVVANIDISYFLAASLSLDRLFFSLLIFLNFWLEWSHANIVLSTTKLVQPWSNLLLLVIVGALGLASNLVGKQNDGSISVGVISTFRASSAVFLLLPRVAFAIIFGNLAWLYCPALTAMAPAAQPCLLHGFSHQHLSVCCHVHNNG